jgi:SAM-dependent methyltransferase
MSTLWKELHSNYQAQDWIEKPSLFAETALQYFPKHGRLLELGAGHGQDSIFFVKQGYEVVSSDIETASLEVNLSKQPKERSEKISVVSLDLKDMLPFAENSFDIVYAHLSLHYFDQETTYEIVNQIERILRPGGIFAFLTNSINDPEYNTGYLLEKDFFQIGKATKRYFSVESTRRLTRSFQINLMDNLGQTYKDQAKGISHLIRFIGQKPLEKNYAMAIPYVGAIIERENNGNREVLIQTRWKPTSDPLYSGTFEFPVGTLDKPYENLYDALAREIDEECGLKLKKIKQDSITQVFESNKNDAVFGFRPFCCTQQLKNGKPWIGFVFICEVENTPPKSGSNESKDIKWVTVNEIKQIFTHSPEKLFSLELPAWEYYFKERNSLSIH